MKSLFLSIWRGAWSKLEIQKIFLECSHMPKWSSNFKEYQSHPKERVKDKSLSLIPRVSDSLGQKRSTVICISNELPIKNQCSGQGFLNSSVSEILDCMILCYRGCYILPPCKYFLREQN